MLKKILGFFFFTTGLLFLSFEIFELYHNFSNIVKSLFEEGNFGFESIIILFFFLLFNLLIYLLIDTGIKYLRPI